MVYFYFFKAADVLNIFISKPDQPANTLSTETLLYVGWDTIIHPILLTPTCLQLTLSQYALGIFES